MSSLKMTFSLASLIFLIALGLVFAPTAVMAHEATPADTTHNPALTDTTGHSLVSSITVDNTYMSATGVVTLTINFAPAVAAVAAGAGTDDDGSLHATTDPVDFDALDDLALQTMAADGTFTASTAVPFVLFGTVRQTRAPSSGVGAVYKMSVATADPPVDGIYYLSATSSHTYNGTATSDQTKRVKIVADSNGPTLSEFMASATTGNTYEGDTGWTKPFEVSFKLMDDGTDGSGVKVDSIMITADPADVTFTNVVRGRTASGFMVTATPKAVTANTAAKDIKISVSATDMAGNAIDPSGPANAPIPVPTLTTKLAARTAGGSTGGIDPPTATIDIDELAPIGVMANFRVRVTFTPATGGDDVTDFDHTKLKVVDSSTPARTVSVMPANMVESAENDAGDDEGNPHPEPLSGTNRYDGVLEYDTRNMFTYPLVVTIDQTALKTHNPMEKGEVGEAAPTPETPETRAVATLTGTASLEEAFQVTITFDKATTLAEDEIMITPAGAGYVDSNSLLPATSATVFTVTIRPTVGAKMITVTVATNTRIKPATTNGSIMASAPIGTVKSITGPADFDGTDPFVVEVEFAKALPTGEMLVAADLMVTGGAVTDVGEKLGSDTVYQVQITPTDTANVKVGLSTAGMVKFEYGTGVMALTVPQRADAPVTGGTVTAAYDATTETTTISAGAIAANGFAVIDAVALPDLQVFFIRGGSITLDDGDAVADANSRTVVISEILWGYDVGLRTVQPLHKGYQFIELYNTTGSSINLAGWKLIFTPGRSIPNIDIDQVSNRQGAGWDLDLSMAGDDGQNGHIYNTTAVNPLNRINGVRIISMYRNIHYYDIEVTHRANRAELLKRVLNGNAKGSWKASVGWTTNPWIYDSKGLKHRIQQVYQPGSGVIVGTTVPRSPFVINEIGNSTGGENDWIELRNVTGSEASLKNYQLSVVTGPHNETYDNTKHKDTQLFHFHDKDYKVPAGGVVLVTSTHPRHNDLAAGRDISLGVDDQVLRGLTHLYVVRPFNIPDSGRSLLILRKSAKSHEKQHLGTANDIQDVVGTLRINDNTRGTHLWPLNATGAPHGNVIDGTDDEDFRAGKVYQRSNAGGGTGEKHLAVRGYTGVGYDRHAAVSGKNNNGTPGYDNGAVKADKSNWMNQVSISEIMLPIEETTTANDRVPRATRLPQWIEIYNNSMTEAVSLNNWYLEIQNTGLEFDSFSYLGNLHATLRLPNVIVQPNQTILVVSSAGLNSGHFPEQRTINLFTKSEYRNELGIRSRGEPILNPKGFYVQLRDNKNNHVDEVGNLGLSHRTGRTGVGRRDEDVDTWDINLEDLISTDGHRTSLIRIYDRGVPRNGLNKIGGPTDQNTSWVRASVTKFRNVPSLSYFGNHRDYGTPGYRGGGPLPVSLSKFRPERLKDTGEIVVRWVTESELNNAGFNILRSETRDGEFTKINTSLIAGQGTTSEQTTYTWKDTSAKPNVVYYYQIQDVSLDGQVQTLRQSRLKGNVTAAGKATTTWGQLKALQ